VSKAVWYDADHDVPVEEQLRPGGADVADLAAKILRVTSGRGHPALQLLRDDGSSLSLATDGTRAFLMWANSLGETFSSVGSSKPCPPLVYDFFGSWSEAASENLVSLKDAVVAAGTFLVSGIPDTAAVIFRPD
jgi:hypothetical protein